MARYKTLGTLRNGGMQKDINDYQAGVGTEYLLANQRGQYLVTVSPAKRLAQGGFLLNTAGGTNGTFIFVMDGEGAIYSANKAEVNHHSSFLAGGPVAAAGHWEVEYGALKWIGNESGHYQPPFDYTQQILTELNRLGVDTSGVEQDWTGLAAKAKAKVTIAMGVTFDRIGARGVERSSI